MNTRLASASALVLSFCGVGTVIAAGSIEPVDPPAPPSLSIAPVLPPKLDAPLLVPEPPVAALPQEAIERALAKKPKAKKRTAPKPRVAQAVIASEPINVAPAPAPEAAPAPEPVPPLLPELAACVTDTAEDAAAVEGTQLAEAWRVPVDGEVVGEPVLHESCVVALTSTGKLLAVQADSGEVVLDGAAPEPVKAADDLAAAIADAAPLPELVDGAVRAEDDAEAAATPRAAGELEGEDPLLALAVPVIGDVAKLVAGEGLVVAAPAGALVGLKLTTPAPAAAAPAPVVPPVELPAVPVG